MREAEFQQQVMDACHLLRLKVYHTHDSRRSEPGFPDLVIVGRSVLFVELKSEKGRVSADQMSWGDALVQADADWMIWRPAMMDATILPMLRSMAR